MKNYILYDTTGKILEIGTIDTQSFNKKTVDVFDTDISIMEIGRFNLDLWKTHEVDPTTQKIIPKNDDKKSLEIYEKRQHQTPGFHRHMSDQEIDDTIMEFFGGHEEPGQWKKKHYSVLRSVFYPPSADLIDAQVKLYHPDPDIQSAGREQLDGYVVKCLAVKARFQKPENQENKGGSRGGV